MPLGAQDKPILSLYGEPPDWAVGGLLRVQSHSQGELMSVSEDRILENRMSA